MPLPCVAAITVNWNTKENTAACLNSLYSLDYPNLIVIVVDNASTDGSVEFLQTRFLNAVVIGNERNVGYGQGMNRGMNYAVAQRVDYFLILNSDTIIDAQALRALVEVAESDRTIGFVSGKVYYHHQPNVLQTVGKTSDPIAVVGPHIGMGEVDHEQYDLVCEREFTDDIFLLVRRELFEQTGGYDPDFFFNCEEANWCIRARRAGFKIMYTPEAKLWHKVSASTGGRLENPVTTCYTAKSWIILVWKHRSWAVRLTYLASVFGRLPRRVLGLLRRRQCRVLLGLLKGIGAGLLWALRASMNRSGQI